MSVAVRYPAEVEGCEREIEVAPLISGAEVEGHTETVGADIAVAVEIHARHILAALLVDLVLVLETADIGIDIGIGTRYPLVFAEFKIGFVEICVHIGHAHQKFHGGAHTQTRQSLYVARVVEGYLGVSLCAGAEVAYVVGLVRNAFLSEAEKCFGHDGIDVGAGVDRHGVISAESLEAGRKDIYFHIRADAVFIVNAVHNLGGAYAGIGEEDGASVEAVDDARQMEIAAHGDIHVAQSGHRHERTVIAESGVHLVAVVVAVEEVTRVGILCHGGDGGGHYAAECEYAVDTFHLADNGLEFFFIISAHFGADIAQSYRL